MSLPYEIKKFGIGEVFIHALAKMRIIPRYKVYQYKLQHYYSKLTPKDYKRELNEWWKEYGESHNEIDSPQTFNEKIQWLKFYDSTPIKTRLADKYLVRNWVKEQVGEKYLIDLLGVYDRFEEIDFDILPNQFVLKANHGSGMNIIVRDKHQFNKRYVQRETDRWMDTVFGYEGMEIHYFNIPRKIMIEKYIEQVDGKLFDYKIHCFNGKPEYIQIIGDRDLRTHAAYEAFFDLDWNMMDFHYTYPIYKRKIARPGRLDELLRIAGILCKGFKYVRVDLYIIDESIKFGEMTFTPANGNDRWNPPEADYRLGRLINLES